MEHQNIPLNQQMAPKLVLLHQVTTEALEDSVTVPEALEKIIQAIGSVLNWEVGVFWELNNADQLLECEVTWQKTKTKYDHFAESSKKSKFTIDEGLPGQVWSKQEAIWNPDIKTASNFPRLQAAEKDGLSGAVAFPIRSKKEFFGVMEFFSHDVEPYDHAIVKMMEVLGYQIGQFIKHIHIEQELIKKQLEVVDFIENGSLPLHWVGPDGIILWANQAELDALGYTREEYIGKPITHFHADQEIIADILSRLTKNETLQNYEAKLLRKDGSVRDVLINSSVYRDGKRFVHTRCFTRDVTEIKQAQKELEKSIRLRDEFLSIASHELKTPITSLQFQIQLLERSGKQGSMDPLSAPTVLSKIEIASRNLHRLTKLIDDLLDVSRIRAAKLECDFAETDLNALAQEVVGRFKDENAGKININLHDSPGMKGHWDRTRIEQVLNNLISNAIRYGNEKPVHVTLESQEETISILVQDQGIGISPEDLPRIFDSFERAVSARNFGGLGLGLYITKQIVSAHGGSIEVESKLGEGTTFKVILPRECR